MLLTESSEVSWLEHRLLLCLILSFWWQNMANRMSLCVCFRCWQSIPFREQVFTDETFDMACIAWNFLSADHVGWTIRPVDCILWFVSIDSLIFVKEWLVPIWVYPSVHIRGLCKVDRMNTSVTHNLSLSFPCSLTKSLVLAWHMTCITRHVLFCEISWNCKSCH